MMPESGHKTGFLVTGILVAAGLWLYMFSPWTSQISNFWLNMTVSAVILSVIAICGLRRGGALKDVARSPHSRCDGGAGILVGGGARQGDKTMADRQASKGCVGLMLSDGEPLRIFGIELRWRWLDGIIGGGRQGDKTMADGQASKGCVGLIPSDGEPLRVFGIELRWRWLDGIIGGGSQKGGNGTPGNGGTRLDGETLMNGQNGGTGKLGGNDGALTKGQGFWKKAVTQVVIGVIVAFALWGVFWIGDKVSQLIFDFARGQVDNVYGMKSGVSPALITVLLLFLIGPAEEVFWRGFVQRMMSERIGATAAMFVTTVIYALVHIWSFNFMLVMAALVAGAVWGFLYRLKPSLLPALIISHALWDALVFVLLPI